VTCEGQFSETKGPLQPYFQQGEHRGEQGPNQVRQVSEKKDGKSS